MPTLRKLLSALVLVLWWPLAAAVDLGTSSGVKFFQIGYTTTPYTGIGWIRVDANQLRRSTGIGSGYINVATAAGWVVRNVPVAAEDVFPYGMVHTRFNLGTPAGTAVGQLTAAVSYTPDLLTSFSATPATSFTVAEYQMSLGGTGSAPAAPGPSTPPDFTDVLFSDPSRNDRWIQWDHPNEEAAMSQCAPMSIANSLKYLSDTQGLSLPFEHKPGFKGDDSLVGKIDTASGRTASSRQSGEGISTGQAKLKFLATHMSGKVETMIWGKMGADDGGTNQTVTIGSGSATMTGKGTTIKMDEILEQLKQGANCEVVYSFDTGGAHAVDLVGAGFHNGAPWMLAVSDVAQANLANGDSRGAGPEGMEFMYLGKPDASGKYKSGNQTIEKVICEKPVPPPVTETVISVQDPAGHSCCISPPPPTVRVARVNDRMTVSGDAEYFPLSGTITPAGAFSLFGTATVAGFADVTTTFSGNVQGSNYLGVITVGAGGELPSAEPIRFTVSIPRSAMPTRPAIRANGFRHRVQASAADVIRPMISMAAGSQAGQNGDWWLVASAGDAFYHFDLGVMNWRPGLLPSYTGPLTDLSYFPLPYVSLPSGAYDLYFGFDSVPDGQLNMNALQYDKVRITVQ